MGADQSVRMAVISGALCVQRIKKSLAVLRDTLALLETDIRHHMVTS